MVRVTHCCRFNGSMCMCCSVDEAWISYGEAVHEQCRELEFYQIDTCSIGGVVISLVLYRMCSSAIGYKTIICVAVPVKIAIWSLLQLLVLGEGWPQPRTFVVVGSVCLAAEGVQRVW